MRDFIDVYLTEIENETDPESSFFREKGIENLIQTLSDLFFAGSETTRQVKNICSGVLFR